MTKLLKQTVICKLNQFTVGKLKISGTAFQVIDEKDSKKIYLMHKLFLGDEILLQPCSSRKDGDEDHIIHECLLIHKHK